MIQYLSKVLYVLTGAKVHIVFLLLAFISSSLLEVIGIGLIGPFLSLASNPQLVREVPLLNRIYNFSGFTSYSKLILLSGIVLVLLFIARSLAYFLARFYILHFSFKQKVLLTSRLMKRYLEAPYIFHLHKNTSSSISNIIWEIDNFTNGCVLQLLTLVANFLAILFLLILLGATDLSFLALSLAVMLPVFAAFSILSKKFKEWGQIASESQRSVIRGLNHGLGGIKETRIIGCEHYFEQEVVLASSRFCRQATLSQSGNLLPGIVIQTCIVTLMVLSISVSQVLSGQNVQNMISTLGIFAFSGLRLVPYCSQFIASVGHIRGASYSLDMLYSDLKELEQRKPHTASHSSAIIPSVEDGWFEFEGVIDLKEVTYYYPTSKVPALKDISLSINKGESIAFIGKSGAGKTTLVDVILGLLEPEKGDILVDGVSIYRNLRAWQNLVGYIPQSIFLVDDTIEKNIAFGISDDQINREKLWEVIKAAQLEELVEQLPNGVKTEVGERGVRLSGGQRQRIGIARALYHEREILVLDEATAALDNETESLVAAAINSLAGAKTLIIIAHRLSTVEQCDRIYMLDAGSIIQSGSYKEVVLQK